jgi:hypothetical protein
MRAAGTVKKAAAMYPNHYIERRHVINFSRQLARESCPLPGVPLRKAFVYTFVVSRTDAATGPIVYPRIPDELICNIVA